MKTQDREVIFSTGKDDWGTPKLLFDKLHYEFNFCVDVCAESDNALLDQYVDEYHDALKCNWGDYCTRVHAASRYYIHNFFMNPPYSNVAAFIERMAKESIDNKHNRYVALVASRTDTKWFHEWVLPFASEIRFIKGRLTFAGAESTAPFPSLIVVYNTATSSRVDGYGPKITSWSPR